MSEGAGGGRAWTPTGGYELFPVTADKGIRAWGRDPAEVFIQAARGLWSLIVLPETVRRERAIPLEAEAADPESLLVGWLNEMLYLHEVEVFVAADCAVQRLTTTRVQGEIWGERLDRARHSLVGQVKAVTYHQLQLTQSEHGWEARVIVDV